MSVDKPSARQQAYIENRGKGIPRRESALMAGYSGDTNNMAKVEEIPKVAAELARIRKEAAENSGVTKEDVVAGLKAAAEMAHTLADPTGAVAAWRELGKLLGFYAPEVKKIEKSINKRDLRAALEDMSDSDLLELSRGRVIEGKFIRVTEPEPPKLPDLQKD